MFLPLSFPQNNARSAFSMSDRPGCFRPRRDGGHPPRRRHPHGRVRPVEHAARQSCDAPAAPPGPPAAHPPPPAARRTGPRRGGQGVSQRRFSPFNILPNCRITLSPTGKPYISLTSRIPSMSVTMQDSGRPILRAISTLRSSSSVNCRRLGSPVSWSVSERPRSSRLASMASRYMSRRHMERLRPFQDFRGFEDPRKRPGPPRPPGTRAPAAARSRRRPGRPGPPCLPRLSGTAGGSPPRRPSRRIPRGKRPPARHRPPGGEQGPPTTPSAPRDTHGIQALLQGVSARARRDALQERVSTLIFRHHSL